MCTGLPAIACMAVRDSTVKVAAINFFMEFPFGGCQNGVSHSATKLFLLALIRWQLFIESRQMCWSAGFVGQLLV